MAGTDNFERLANSLSLDERQGLLQKLKKESNVSADLLYQEDAAAFQALNIESQFTSLPWYYRFWFMVLSLFKTTPPLKLFEDHQVSVLGGKTDEKSPGLYDYQRGILLPSFRRQLQRLKEAARFFYSALDLSVNRDKGAFFAFLGSLEMPEIHKRLDTETDPVFITERYPEIKEMELRQHALKSMDDILALVNEDNRNAMYFNARSLNCLKELSSFPFDRVLMTFGSTASAGGETCSAAIVKELLMSLNNILTSLKIVPPVTLLESLFVFVLLDREKEPGFDLTREIRGLMTKAEESLGVIRDFNKNVPLTWILRCVIRDMSYSPRIISGGEDWFVVYRDFWKRRIESLFSEFMKDRKRRELLNSFRYFLKGTSLRLLKNTQSETNSEGFPLRGAFGLSFLATFFSVVFMPDINWILRPILIDGEFKQKEDRMEFMESYNVLIKLDDEIKKIEQDISPAGDFGKRYAQVRQEMSVLPVKRRKIQIVTDEASNKAGEILGEAREASQKMADLLGGILGRDLSGRHESLTNLGKIIGKDSRFIPGITEIIQQFQKVISILDEIEIMESGR